MISIITAVHNQLEMNKIFLEYIKKNTHNEYELIIIDNASTDGTREFFQGQSDIKVIANKFNYSYPYCQNQGIKIASADDYFFFLNNDIIVPENWDEDLINSMEKNGLEVATCCGIELLENLEKTKKIKRRWKSIKNILYFLFGSKEWNLRFMHKLMYKNWDSFIRARRNVFKNKTIEGFVGNSVAINKSAFAKIGLWDERIQAADFDLYLRTKERNLTVGDIKPVHVLLDCFHHHYIRLTFKTKYPPFKDTKNLISCDEKWGKDKVIDSMKARKY